MYSKNLNSEKFPLSNIDILNVSAHPLDKNYNKKLSPKMIGVQWHLNDVSHDPSFIFYTPTLQKKPAFLRIENNFTEFSGVQVEVF